MEKEEIKKYYEKPELKVIDLVAEEVLGTSCNGSGGRAPGENLCASGVCHSYGS